MKKMRLRLDDLAVESFDTHSSERLMGTVHGNDLLGDAEWAWAENTGGKDTCRISCGGDNHTQCGGTYCRSYIETTCAEWEGEPIGI